jgi:hypothetical protein
MMRDVRVAVAVVIIVAGCGSSSGGGDDAPVVDAPTGDGADAAMPPLLPPINGKVDYQLGGSYTPPSGVTVVSRDRKATPAPGLYNICYVNGFQIQPEENDWWLTQHPDLILRDANGDPVIDTAWNEMLLDIRLA